MITFILPTVNRDTLEAAVSSIINQSNPNWKLMIIGDKCIPNIETADPRIETWRVLNCTCASDVRNSLVHKITTEWVGFIDDDDILCPEYVAEVERVKDQTNFIMFKMQNYDSIIPHKDVIKFGNVGISFAMKTDLLRANPFQGWECGEDFRMIKAIEDSGEEIYFSEYLGYIVRPHLES